LKTTPEDKLLQKNLRLKSEQRRKAGGRSGVNSLSAERIRKKQKSFLTSNFSASQKSETAIRSTFNESTAKDPMEAVRGRKGLNVEKTRKAARVFEERDQYEEPRRQVHIVLRAKRLDALKEGH